MKWIDAARLFDALELHGFDRPTRAFVIFLPPIPPIVKRRTTSIITREYIAFKSIQLHSRCIDHGTRDTAHFITARLCKPKLTDPAALCSRDECSFDRAWMLNLVHNMRECPPAHSGTAA